MGCVVNGTGEAKEANIALCGGKNEALLYIDGVIVGKYPQNEIVPILKKAIRQYKVKS
jgi:(E)-4-hydroxy-3-methylbut-2-enyl-diphosphate synthase